MIVGYHFFFRHGEKDSKEDAWLQENGKRGASEMESRRDTVLDASFRRLPSSGKNDPVRPRCFCPNNLPHPKLYFFLAYRWQCHRLPRNHFIRKPEDKDSSVVPSAHLLSSSHPWLWVVDSR
nr:hypothetical protein 68B2.160 [imported] - Neurospora crassa [Neurospora crassa]